MTTEVLTLKKPGRCPVSLSFQQAFMAEAVDASPQALASLRLHAREKDKWLILQHKLGVNHA